MANAGYIASMGAPLPLKFASAEGNSAVVIDGTPMSSNVTLDGALFTPLRLQFTVADVDSDGNIDRLIKIRLKGVTYSGVVESLQALYAREEAAKYKLIITEISA